MPRGSALVRVGEAVIVSILAWRDDNGCLRAARSTEARCGRRARIFPSPCQGEDRRACPEPCRRVRVRLQRVFRARFKILLCISCPCVIQSAAKNPGSDIPLARRERIEGEGLCSASVFSRGFKILLCTSCPCVILERSEESRLPLCLALSGRGSKVRVRLIETKSKGEPPGQSARGVVGYDVC
jgi:hypothetical protein